MNRKKKEPPSGLESTYSIPEIAAALHSDEKYVRRIVNERLIATVVLPGKKQKKITQTEFKAFLERNSIPAVEIIDENGHVKLKVIR